MFLTRVYTFSELLRLESKAIKNDLKVFQSEISHARRQWLPAQLYRCEKEPHWPLLAMNYFSRHQLQSKLQPLLKTNPRCVASSTGTCNKNWAKEKQLSLDCIIAPPTRSSGRTRAQSSFVFSAIERPKLTHWSLIHKQYCVPVSD